jgi:hypothetical protein
LGAQLGTVWAKLESESRQTSTDRISVARDFRVMEDFSFQNFRVYVAAQFLPTTSLVVSFRVSGESQRIANIKGGNEYSNESV